MGRLVDIEDVKDFINGLDSLPWEEELDNELKYIPTAYDKKKVEEELKITFEQTVAEILDVTDSEYTIADFNIKPYSNRICNVVKRGGVE